MPVRKTYPIKITLFLLTSTLIFLASTFALASNNNVPNNEVPNNSDSSIPYCVDPDWMPYEAIDDGKHIGISSDYLSIIKQHTNLTFTLVTTSTWQQTIKYLKTGQCHLVLMLNKSPKREKYLTFSDVYYRSPNVLVSLREQPFIQDLSNLNGRSLGVVKNYRIAEYIETYFPKIQKTYVGSEGEGVKLVAEKKLDAFVGSMLSLNARTQQYGYGNLKVAGWAGPEDELRFGVIKGKEAILADINYAITQISEKQRIDIFKKWNNVRIIKEFDHTLLFQLLAIVLVITLLFILRQRQLNRFNRLLSEKNKELESLTHVLEKTNHELEYISFHDPLTDLYNRSYFSQHIKDKIHDINRSQSPTCLMLVDIDHFKQVNDELGHNVGDEVLTQLSQVFNEVIRQSDIAARWGGEEFVFLLPETSIDSAKKLATRLLNAVREHHFNKVGQVTVSIGIAEYDHKSDFHNWFERADKALYRAKDAGRDQLSC